MVNLPSSGLLQITLDGDVTSYRKPVHFEQKDENIEANDFISMFKLLQKRP